MLETTAAGTDYCETGAGVPMPATGACGGWFYPTSNTTRQQVWHHGGTDTGLAYRGDTTQELEFYREGPGFVYATVNAVVTNFAHWGLNKPVFIMWQWVEGGAASDQKAWIGDLNNAPAEPSAYAGTRTVVASPPPTTAGAVRLMNNISSPTRYCRGRIGMFFVAPGVLDAAQRDAFRRCLMPVACEVFAMPGWGGVAHVPDWSGNGRTGAVSGMITAPRLAIAAKRKQHDIRRAVRGNLRGVA
jgi:hypothetical protein